MSYQGAGLAEGVECVRPLGLLALIPAAIVLLAGLVRERPLERPLGTTALWRQLLEERKQKGARANARKRRRFPLHLWVLSLALGFAALAMAGPKRKAPPLTRRFAVYADTSLSMQLPWGGGEFTRAEVARQRFELWRSEQGDRGVTFDFREGLPKGSGATGEIVLTDEAEPWLESAVGLFASGGAAVPGVVGIGTDDAGEFISYVLNADGIVEEVPRAERCFVTRSGLLPVALDELFAVWAAERGFDVREGESALLRLQGPERSLEGAVAMGGIDGWSARGPIGALGKRAPEGFVWLRGLEDGPDLVRVGAGEIGVAWTSFVEREGADTDFALSWAQLFDGTVLTPAGVVGVKDRRDAGEAVTRLPKGGDVPQVEVLGGHRFPLEFVSASLAVLLACVAAWLRGRVRRC